ncbi:MAG: cyclic nucleotide-binding domain-containing protein [Pseudomonadota bacterium]
MLTHSLEAIPKSRAFRIEVCESLSRSPLFKDWSWDELDTLSSYMAGYRAKAGDLLFEEGDDGDAMGLLLSGQIEVKKQDTAGIAQFVTHIVAGRTFGEMAAIDGEKRSATCIATEPCVLALLPKVQFDRILTANEALGIKLLLRVTRLLSERLRKVNGALVDFLSKDAG